jgi:hypothetical protein
MRNPYDVHIEFIRDEVITVNASDQSEAMSIALEKAEQMVRADETPYAKAVNINMEY